LGQFVHYPKQETRDFLETRRLKDNDS
jgi:hypothetical protein